MEKERVLQIIAEPFENGGQELFITNLYKNIDKERIQFDFVVPYSGKNEKLKNEVESLGANFYAANIKHKEGGLVQRISFFKTVNKVLKENKYSIVHINSVSLLGMMFGVLTAKRNQVKNIIVHSHSDGFPTMKYKVMKKISDYILRKHADYYFACSEKAAKWKFPEEVIKQKKHIVIKNGIDVDKFKFNEEIRKEYRNQFKIDDKFVLGHVGRFAEEKNHKFIINVFEELLKKEKKAVLLLIGEGSLKSKIEEQVKEKNIQENVKFLGVRNDVNNILQAMDVFIFPSIFEGLGIAAIEAECGGLPVICSNKLPKEIEITDQLIKMSLLNSPEEWAEKILEIKEKQVREQSYERINKCGYNIKEVANDLEMFYLDLI